MTISHQESHTISRDAPEDLIDAIRQSMQSRHEFYKEERDLSTLTIHMYGKSLTYFERLETEKEV